MFRILKALTTYLAFTSGASASLVKEDNPLTTVSKIPLSLSPTCTTIIFSEVHTDSTPAREMKKLLPHIIEINELEHPSSKPILHLEEPRDTTPKQFQKTLQQGIASPYVPPLMKESLKATLDLMLTARKLDVRMNTMDMGTELRARVDTEYSAYPGLAEELRDVFMANQIDKFCKKYGGTQTVLVGAWHSGGIEQQLRELEYNDIIQIYVMNHAPFIDPSSPAGRTDNDVQIRTNTAYREMHGLQNVNIIDIYTHPALNATEEILHIFDINGFSARSHLLSSSIEETELVGSDSIYSRFPDEDCITQ